jgi:hypothetical protein
MRFHKTTYRHQTMELLFDTIIKNSKEELRFINLRWNVIRGYENH